MTQFSSAVILPHHIMELLFQANDPIKVPGPPNYTKRNINICNSRIFSPILVIFGDKNPRAQVLDHEADFGGLTGWCRAVIDTKCSPVDQKVIFLLPEVDMSFLGLWGGQQIKLLKDSTFLVPKDHRVTITITITIMEAILRKIKDYHTITTTLSPLAPLQISLATKTLKCCFRMWWIAAFSSATRIRWWR